MADKPAEDDEEQTRADEWGEGKATEVVPASAIPTQLLEPQNTDPLRLTPTEFAGVVDQTERDGYRRGLAAGDAAGFKRGLAEGRADIRAQDIEDGRGLGYDDFRRCMIACGTDPMVAFLEMQKLREWARRHPR